MRRIALGALALALTGCATGRSGDDALGRADRLVDQGEFAAAVQAYDDALARHLDEQRAFRARTSRDAVASLIAARADVARLQQALATREGEVSRLRQELQRVTQEADRLRADLETLKEIDLRQERKRR